MPSLQAAQANDESRSRQRRPRKVSAAARRRISLAQKARWAKLKALSSKIRAK